MAKKRYQVMVDTWGSAPEFTRGRVLDLDLDDTDAMTAFPYDVQHAIDQGILLDLDAEEQRLADQRAQAEADGAQREAETAPARTTRTTTATAPKAD